MIELPAPKTVIEPFRIKMVEDLPMTTASQRAEWIKKAHYNLFFLPAKAVTFDFLTDSGTGAMSARQWGGMMVGDESYAGASSFHVFEKTVQEITHLRHVIPTHQGRAAEALLFKAMVQPGQVVIGNTHFDTTRANIEARGAIALDFPDPSPKQPQGTSLFRGNIYLNELREYLKENAKKVPLVILTITNNSIGGQPVSLANIRETKKILEPYGIPLFLDCARFAENAYFIKLGEAPFQHHSIAEIVGEMFSHADGALMSAKKDGLVNIGGFLAVNSETLAAQVHTEMVLTEGFPTYGGLAGRDMEALAIGLKEAMEEAYLQYRVRSTAYLGAGLADAGFKMIQPFGGHAVYIDAGASLPHLPTRQFPGQVLAVALYEAIGVRGVEVGSVMMGRRDPKTGEEIPAARELLRLAIPRRVYTQSHVDYIIEMARGLVPRLAELQGLEIAYQPQFLRHFSARFRPVNAK